MVKEKTFSGGFKRPLYKKRVSNLYFFTSTLAAKLVDYGEFSMLPIHNMQPLWPQFRNLPMQAISATLNSKSCVVV